MPQPHSPKKKAKALTLAVEGVPPHEVAKRLKIPIGTIHFWISKARQEGISFPSFPRKDAAKRNTGKVIRLWEDVAVEIEAQAKKRGYCSAALLVNKLLATMIDEPHLIDAVIDEER